MNYSKCVASLSLNGKIPARELKSMASDYQKQGMTPDAAMIRAVEDKLELAQMDERRIVKAVREAYEKQGGKKRKPKAKPAPKLEKVVVEQAAPVQEPRYSVADDAGVSPTKRAKNDERDLIFTHNLTGANLLHANKMGGIAVPSLAITKKDSALTSFGDITMIGSKAMADPKGYAKTQVFGADIYSPRYPNVERELDRKASAALDKKFRPMAEKMGINLPGTSELERDGQREMERNMAVMATFLAERGLEPIIVMREGSLDGARVARLKKFGLGPYLEKTSVFDLTGDPEFVRKAADEAIDAYRQAGDERLVKRGDSLAQDEEAQRNIARDLAYKITSDAKQRLRPEADSYQTRQAIEKQIADAGLSEQFQSYVEDELSKVTKSERIFQGFTSSGNRKYTPHTLENVVKILKKELRGGENFNYGVGSLRAHFTPQFKTVAQIKKEKGRLVGNEEFAQVRKEIDAEFDAVNEAMGNLRLETVIAILEDAPKMGLERAAKQYGIELSDVAKQKSAEFLTRLHHLPTEYFEAKILRDVHLSEFSGAVIPHDTPQSVRNVLDKNGVKYIEYKNGDEQARRLAVEDFTQQLDEEKGDIRFSATAEDAASAIDRLMQEKSGEAIVTVPGVGEVSIPYGDSKSGLAHIARRRGEAFLPRVADLLQRGEVYKKPGQPGRIFLGLGPDEAVLSLDRNGEAGTWLLSAYEKYPDLKSARLSEVTEERMPEGKYFTKDDLRKSLTSEGILGTVIDSMIEAGVVVLHGGPNKLPGGTGRRVKGVQAVTMPDGTIHLVASNLTPRTAFPVMMHEMFHQGGEKLIGTKEWGNLMGRLGSLYRQSEQSSGKAREFYDRARARVAAAKAKGAVGKVMEVEEFAAYAIEEYEKSRDSLPAAIRKWVEDLIGLVKTWLVKSYGKQVGEVTPAQLAAMARWAVMDVAAERRGQIFGEFAERFSAGAGQTDTPSFKRWFGDSKVVDENGAPLVVYHGTSDGGFTTFDNLAAKNSDANQGAGDDGLGFFFTDDRELSEQHRDRLDGERPAWMPANKQVYEVYLSLKNPYVTSNNVTASRRAELEREGYDGVIYDFGSWKEYVAFRPEQIKSAIGNTGTFDPENADIRYSVADDTPAEPVALTPPEQGPLRQLQSAVQDSMSRVKQVQDRITKLAGRAVGEKADYYGAETNRPGRIAARLEDAQRHLFDPLMKRLAKSGYTQEQLSSLLHAEHAHERNEAVARINPEMPDGGSGMTNDQADAILALYEKDTELHAIAQQARDIARATLDLKLAYGLITPADYDALATMYENYVPLKGDGEYGPKIKRAMGHDEREEHILENIARDYQQGVIVGEKNLARQSLLRLVLQNPDPDLWTVGVPPKGRYVAGKVYDIFKGAEKVASFTSRAQVQAFLEDRGANAGYTVRDSAGEQVTEFTKPLQDNEVMVYVKGDPVRIQIGDEKLARQLRPIIEHRDLTNWVVDKLRALNRWKAAIYTGRNPAFIPKNMARDAMTGSINMTGRYGAATAARAWGKYPAAFAAMLQYASTGKVPAGEIGAMLTEYRQHGGKVGASHMSDLEEQGKTLTRMFDDAYGAGGFLRDGRVGKASWVASRKLIGGLAHGIEIVNQAAENSLRLGLYAALRDQGASPAKAAQAAKTVTVDFDRKGEATGMLGALYLFINPAIQGTANMVKTLAEGEHKAQAWALVGALAAAGAYAAGAGMDDDKERWLGEEWDARTKNFIQYFGKHRLSIPLSQEYAPFYAAGVALAEARRGESATKSSVRLMSSFLDAYFPLQGAFHPDSDNHGADLAMATVPTAIRPHVESAFNRNSFGGQIVPETENTKSRPDNLKMNRSTKNTVYDKTAQGIAAAGELLGAGKYENDWTKVSPETLKHLWRTYTGGVGQFIADSAGLAAMMGEDTGQVEVGDVPIAKDFVKGTDSKQLRGRYYDLAKEAKAAAEEFRMAKKAGDDEAMDKILGDKQKEKLLGLAKLVTSTNKAAAELADEKVDIAADESLTGAQKREKLKQVDQQEQELYRDAIEAFQ